LRFPTVKLLDYRTQRESLERSNNPFAVMVAAHLEAQQTRKQPQQRYRAKLALVKSLYRRGYSREDILELFRLIDWMMSLPASVQREFNQEIARFEEEQQMPYVTSVERLARQEGQQETSRENTIEALQLRFGEVPEDFLQAIARIDDLSRLKILHRQAIVSNSLEEFRQYLSV
jgi:FMN phosphatase YigB (HAD superfamily)